MRYLYLLITFAAITPMLRFLESTTWRRAIYYGAVLALISGAVHGLIELVLRRLL